MKPLLAVLLCVTFPLDAFGGDMCYKETYNGGSSFTLYLAHY